MINPKDVTWFGKHVEFDEREGFGPALREQVPAWLRAVGALEVEDVPPIRCSSSEPITQVARFEWLPVRFLRVTVYICHDYLQVTVCLNRQYESREHMMTSDAAKFVESGRHLLDVLDQPYPGLLTPELRETWDAEGKKR